MTFFTKNAFFSIEDAEPVDDKTIIASMKHYKVPDDEVEKLFPETISHEDVQSGGSGNGSPAKKAKLDGAPTSSVPTTPSKGL